MYNGSGIIGDSSLFFGSKNSEIYKFFINSYMGFPRLFSIAVQYCNPSKFTRGVFMAFSILGILTISCNSKIGYSVIKPISINMVNMAISGDTAINSHNSAVHGKTAVTFLVRRPYTTRRITSGKMPFPVGQIFKEFVINNSFSILSKWNGFHVGKYINLTTNSQEVEHA